MRFVLAAVVAALVFAPAAGANIIPGKSIAGVELSMTQAEVTGVLGTPDQVKHGTNFFGSFTRFKYHRLTVFFQGDASVTAVKTTRTSEKTPKGVGVGSTRKELKAGVTKLHCPTKRFCQKGQSVPGARVTAFWLFHGKVTAILVGFVID